TPAITLWDADEIHRIMKNDEQIWSAAMAYNALMFGGLDPRGGNAEMLLTLDFDDHKSARKILQPAFTPSALEGYLRTGDRIITGTVREWAKRGHVDLKSESRTLLARVAGEVFAGLRSEDDLATLDRALADFWNVMVALSKNPWISPTYRRARKGLATLIE